MQLVRSRRVQASSSLLSSSEKGRSVPQYLEAFSSKVHQNSIHPIQRGTRHQSDVEITHGCGVWRIPRCCVQAGMNTFTGRWPAGSGLLTTVGFAWLQPSAEGRPRRL